MEDRMNAPDPCLNEPTDLIKVVKKRGTPIWREANGNVRLSQIANAGSESHIKHGKWIAIYTDLNLLFQFDYHT